MIASKGQRALGITFLVTLAFCIFEFLAGKWSGSLALIADASHMLTDLGALGLAFFAGLIASKRSTPKMSYGFYRIEVFSALINGAVLVALSILIVHEAFHRLNAATEVRTGVMMAVGLAGFIFDLTNCFLLKRFAEDNINIRGALLHFISDALGSLGTMIAGGIMMMTGWHYADPLVSLFIAFLIVVSAWQLLKNVVEVLLEATPSHIDIKNLENKILSFPGIEAIHDLHVWSLSPGKESLSAHLEVTKGADRDKILEAVNHILSQDYHIDHTTLQIETAEQKEKEKSHFHD